MWVPVRLTESRVISNDFSFAPLVPTIAIMMSVASSQGSVKGLHVPVTEKVFSKYLLTFEIVPC